MHPLHYVAMLEMTRTTDERELTHRIELYHARRHEQREARRTRRRRILARLRALRPARATPDIAVAPH